MVWNTDTGKSSFDTGQDIWDTGKWSGILVNPVLILVKTSADTGKWSGNTGKSSFDTGQVIWDTGKSSLGNW